MKNSKQSHDSVQQNASNVKQSHKHDANLQKNSTLYFQVGLIVCLLAALGLLEMQFENKSSDIAIVTCNPIDEFDMQTVTFKPYVKPEQKQQIRKQEQVAKKFIDKFEEEEDNTDLPEDIYIEPHDTKAPEEPFDANTLNIEKPIENTTVEFINVEQVPIYPGCEKKVGNKARKKCMSDKITRLVQKKFNGSYIASQYGLSGKQSIYVEFLIDNTGKVTDIKSQATHVKLGEEAKRVVNKIPKMQPGMQRDKAVGVRYTLPIVFKAQ